MSPRAEFIALTSVLACLLATLGYVWFSRSSSYRVPGEFETGLATGIAGVLSGAAAAVLSSAWHATASRANKSWSPERFSLNTTVPVMVLFPFLLGLGMGAVNLLMFQSATPLDDASYVMIISAIVGVRASVAGAVPFLLLEFLVCHRYQLRTTVTTGSA